MSVLLLILGLLLFVSLVVVHELGHYIAARRNDVEVEEFGIGFPPMAWKRKLKNGTLFTLNWLPLGGFVKLKGEHDADREPGSFGAASLSAKTKIMLAGVGMNLVAAFVILTFLAASGMPTIIKGQFSVDRDAKVTQEVEHKGEVKVVDVVKDSPAEQIGLQKGDLLLSIADTEIHDPDMVKTITKAHALQSTLVEFRRNGQDITQQVVLGNNSNGKGYLGVTVDSNESGVQVRRFTWSAPIVAVGFMRQVTVLTIKGIGTALKGLGSTLAGLFTRNKEARQAGQSEATQQVTGPLGLFYILKSSTELGIRFVLMIIAIISLTLAIMNALPIPALDGGRLFVLLLFRAARKPLTKRKEEWIHGTGFAVLLILLLVITIVDARRFL